MRLLRSALLKHPLLAVTIGLAALMLRLAVPAGFMPALDHGRLVLTVCSGYGAAQARHAMPSPDKPKADGGCAFADLALPLIGGADPVQAAAALFFMIAAALFAGAALAPCAALRLRPPLRGPPLPA
ncbi:MAG TPA: hypothetical protein VF650_08550 [Allosphingosinicella sp.]